MSDETKSSSGQGDKRTAANQQNSQLSTGPKTELGKQASSMNAFKLGFFSKKALLPREPWEEFQEFRALLLRQFAPRNAIEVALAQARLAQN